MSLIGPECWCGKPSAHQSGWCGVCVIEPAPIASPAPAPDAGETPREMVPFTKEAAYAAGNLATVAAKLLSSEDKEFSKLRIALARYDDEIVKMATASTSKKKSKKQ